VYTDVLITRLRQRGLCCKLFDCFYGCLVYADDILLLEHTINSMQVMLKTCDEFALDLNIKFNGTKSVAVRISCRYNMQCSLFTLSGNLSKCALSVKYLGVYFVAASALRYQLII